MTDKLPDVKEVYELFKKDPLLLQSENQKAFGAQILRNLLVERAVVSSEPTDVDLGEPASRDKFKRMPTPPAGPVNDVLKKEYRDSRRYRSGLSANAFRQLRKITMVARPEFTTDRQGTAFEDDKVAEEELEASGSPLNQRLKIATIGYRVSISKLANDGRLDEEMCPIPPLPGPVHFMTPREDKTIEKLRRTKVRPGADHRNWVTAVEHHVRLALARRSHVILLPEFALPPDNPGGSPTQVIGELAKAADQEFFMFSGSRHEGAYNRGFILSRERGKDVSPIWWHYKVASARGLGENIMGPQSRKLPNYEFDLHAADTDQEMHCKVFVAICYDVFDPTTFINYVVQCADSDDTMFENIILVPSFNPGEEFVHALRDLSFIAKCPVIYVNGLHGDAALFLFGFSISDILAIESRASASPGESGAWSASTAFDDVLNARTQSLKNDIARTESDFQAAVEASKTSKNKSIRRRMFELSRSLSDQKTALLSQQRQLEEFHRELRKLRELGALRHLITKEHCEHCTGSGLNVAGKLEAERTHADDEPCPNDVLYYNIDWRLYRLLKTFRTEFFRYNDQFLPPPFQDAERKAILFKIQEKRDEREARVDEA